MDETRENGSLAKLSALPKRSPKEIAYVHYLLENKTAAEAARLAGYSESVARVQSHSWITEDREDSTKPDLWDYHQKLHRKKIRDLELSATNILNEVKMIAFSDISNFVELHAPDEDMTDPETVFRKLAGRTLRIKSFKEIPKALRPCIESISEDKHGVKIKLHNKLAALDMLMKYMRLYVPEVKPEDDSTVKEINITVNGTKSKLLANGAEDAQVISIDP